jgi:cytidylate kinase
MQPRFEDGRIVLEGRDVTDEIRREDVGAMASRIAVHPALRQALLDLQKSFRRPPGLVADGRDMGTVVFPDAQLKVFLTASAEARAERRHKQLKEKGFSSNMRELLRDLQARDDRDSKRSAAPLAPAEDAYQFDSSGLTIDEVVAQIVDWHGEADRRR